MKKLFLLVSALASIILFYSCRKDIDPIAYDKIEVNLNHFEEIQSSFSGDLILKEGLVQKVSIEGPEGNLDDLDLNVSNGKLKIKFKPKIGLKPRGKFTVHVTSPKIEQIIVSGSGNALVHSLGTATKADLSVSGSGKIEVATCSLSHLDTEISGSGTILINHGTIGNLDLEISGSGNCDTKGAWADYVTARVKGSGSATVWAKRQLNATISGSGDIKYYGNPTVNSSITGSGKIKHLQ